MTHRATPVPSHILLARCLVTILSSCSLGAAALAVDNHPEPDPSVTFSGALDIDSRFEWSHAGRYQPPSPATLELVIDSRLGHLSHGHLLLASDQDASDTLSVHEAVIGITLPRPFPWNIEIGRFQLPFGQIDHPRLSDPLPQLLGDSHGAGIRWRGNPEAVELVVWAANTDPTVSRTGVFGADIGFQTETPNGNLVTLGISWINRISATDLLREHLNESGHHIPGTPGLAARAGFAHGPWHAVVHMVIATAETKLAATHKDRPHAACLTLEKRGRLYDRLVRLAFSRQYSHDAPIDRLPAHSVSLSATIGIDPHTDIGIEYGQERWRRRGRSDHLTLRLSASF